MKTKNEILQKLKQVRYRHIKKSIRKGLARHPHNCVFNKEIEILQLPVRVCSHPELVDNSFGKGQLPICDDRLKDLSPQCPKFCSNNTKEELKESTKSTLSSEVGEIAYHYPDVAALIWVLDDEDLHEFEDLALEPDVAEIEATQDKITEIEIETAIDIVSDQPTLNFWLAGWHRIKQWWQGFF